ncbi:MAG: hypothetical protein GX362_05885 [Methanosarcinaceae archaeon]|nr:hypothetical protein [Methanosarcinaceae archaeon]
MYSKKLMKKESAIIIILLFMITSTAILLWLSFEPFKSHDFQEDAIIPAEEDIGKQAYVMGEILSVRKTFKGEHAIIIMELENSKPSKPFQIFIPNKNGAAEVLEKYKEGDKIGVKGKVELYNEKLEIIVQSEQNIQKIK